jgi:hypothetical protein
LEERDVEVSQRKVFSKSNKKMDARLYENFNTDDKYIHKYTTDDITIEAQSATPRPRYSSRYAQGQNGSNWIIYRLSDIMLLKAEALTQKLREGAEEDDISYNKSIIDEAFTLINAVNKRSVCEPLAQLVDTLQRNDYNTKELVTTLLYQERQRELMFEGKRWYDLVRYAMRENSTSRIMSAASKRDDVNKQFVQSFFKKMDAIFWPYNNEEMKVNQNLIPNPAFSSGESTSMEKTTKQ